MFLLLHAQKALTPWINIILSASKILDLEFGGGQELKFGYMDYVLYYFKILYAFLMTYVRTYSLL